MEPTRGSTAAELPQSAAELALQPLLDAFARQEQSEQELTYGLVDICTQQPAATWQALSLLDRYHRRSVLSTALFRELKKELNAIAFGSADKQTAFVPETEQHRTSARGVTHTQTHFDTFVGGDTAFDADTEFQVDYAETSAPDVTLPRSLRVQQTQLVKTAVEQSPLLANTLLRAGMTLIDRYVLIEPLTSGGIGVVFKALDHQRVALPESERYVAVKCLHERLQNEPRAIAALQHEYTQSQLVSHPTIAKVYDFHQAEGLCFIAMELVEGDSLGRICERIAPRRLPQPSALTIVREIGHALAHAHDRGVVHGNLHPNNVIVTRNGNVRVREFGQATAWLETAAATTVENEARRNINPALTEMRYRSPQQKIAIAADAADDLYSLASIAHELLCGCAPDSKALHDTGRRPNYARHLSARQWQALQHGLADNRPQRGSDVRQWLADLDLSTAHIRLPSLSALEDEVAGERKQTLPRAIVMGAICAAVLIASLATWYFWPSIKPNSPEQIVSKSSEPAPQIKNTPAIPATLPAEATTPPTVTVTESPPQQNTVNTDLPAISLPTAEQSNSQSRESTNTRLPTVSFSQARYDVTTDKRVATLTIRRTGPSGRALTLHWYTIEGSAKSDIDYLRDGNTTVQMLPGQKSAQVTIPIINGPESGQTLSFDVRISATTDAMPGDTVKTTVYLLPKTSADGR